MKNIFFLFSAIMLAGCATSETSSVGQSSGKGSSKATECGRASYYADSLAGNSTASGEPYKPSLRTAAHRTLPFGTIVRVVRKDNGREVKVRVNDRGPYAPGRIIDLSRAAAEKIGLTTAGVADVCIYVK